VPTIQDQYTEFAKRGQEAAFAVVDAWTRAVQDSAVQLPSVTTQAAAQQVIDQAYNFAGTVLDIQRSFAKQLVATSASVAEDVANRATAAANEAGATVTNGTNGTNATTGRAKKQRA
jgi:hypothetical protein